MVSSGWSDELHRDTWNTLDKTVTVDVSALAGDAINLFGSISEEIKQKIRMTLPTHPTRLWVQRKGHLYPRHQ